jgi:hypothetical protein
MTESKFYEFYQNNSGGYFDTSMPRFLWVEASSAEESCAIAEEHGVYFDGADKGIDCECCGDRWYRPYGSVTREELDELIEVRTGPDAFKWDEWPSQEAEFKIVEKED